MAEPRHIFHRWHPLARLGLFALTYGLSVQVGARLSTPPEYISAMWPASGVALSALLLSRHRHWPVLLLTGLLLEPFLYAPGHLPRPSGFLIAAGNLLEALVGALLLRRLTGFRPSLERVRDVLALVGFAALLSPVLGATVGVGVMTLRGSLPWETFATSWRVFWVGDVMGVLLVAPPLLTWATRGTSGWSRARLLEFALLPPALVLTSHHLFHWDSFAGTVFHPVSYLAFPFILWAALRFETRGAAATLLALSAVAITHTMEGTGPFAEGTLASVPPNQRVAYLQSFLAAVGSSGLLLAAALAEQRHAREESIRLNRELRQSLDELAATQQELVRRERLAAIGELSASVAHEVRNPLAVIANSVAALIRLSPPDEDSPTWQLLGIMGEEVARLDHLVNGLLDSTRPVEPRLLPQSLGSVVEGALTASLRSAPESERIQLICELEPELPELPLDAQLLHLALSNLFTNALQAMPRGGSLQVELRRAVHREQPMARLTLRDTGPGIAPEVLPRIFEPFFTTKAAGTGLGLAIVRRIIDAHQGELEVHSTVGQGTTFTLHFPLALSPHASAA